MDRNPSSYRFCWFHNERRRYLMARNDSADYAWNRDGHLHSPLCGFCRREPGVITCATEFSVACYDCFQLNQQNYVTNNHYVMVIPFSFHESCVNDESQGTSSGSKTKGGPGTGPGEGLRRGPDQPKETLRRRQSGRDLNLNLQLGTSGTSGRLMLQQGGTPTKIVCLTQEVTADDVGDDVEYEEIKEDMRQEGGKFGNLVSVVIPRPSPDPDHDPTPGVGKVFLEYTDVDGAAKARAGMNGRKFDGNQVVAVYYPENKFTQGDYEDC